MCTGAGEKEPLRLAAIDVKRAYFYAPAQREVHIEIPAEDREPGDEHRVGRLNLSLYATRDAAQNWADAYTALLKPLGLKQGRASPCNSHYPIRGVNLTVHGDDFLVLGSQGAMHWFGDALKKAYDIKKEIVAAATAATAGDASNNVDEIWVLKRVIRWTSTGIEYEPDQRHVEILLADLGLENAKPVSTPGDAHTSSIIAAALGGTGGLSATSTCQAEGGETSVGQLSRDAISYVNNLSVIKKV